MASARAVAARYTDSAPMSAEQRRWLSALYESNFAAVLKRCGAILKSGEDAADAAHEVFLVALNSLEPDTEERRARAWLLTVAHNHCLDLLRRRRRLGRALLTLGADPDAGSDLEAGIVDRDFVQGVLGQLSLRERLALWQSAVEHRPLADIATGLQLSYGGAAGDQIAPGSGPAIERPAGTGHSRRRQCGYRAIRPLAAPPSGPHRSTRTQPAPNRPLSAAQKKCVIGNFAD